MLSRSLPAWPTNGSPLVSSSAPGPSPTNSQSAFGSPTPGTLFLRPRWSPHAVHASTSAVKSCHSSAAMRAARLPGSGARRCSGSAAAMPMSPSRTTRSLQTGASPISRRMSLRPAMGVLERKRPESESGRHEHRSAHYECVFARHPFSERGVIAFAAADGFESFGCVQRDRGDVRDPNLEENLLGAETARIVDEPAQELSPESLTPRAGHHRQVQDLRLAGREHEDAVSYDTPLALADGRRIAGGKRVAEIAGRPRGRVNLRFERRNVGDVAFVQRTPFGPSRKVTGNGRHFEELVYYSRAPASRSAVVSAT